MMPWLCTLCELRFHPPDGTWVSVFHLHQSAVSKLSPWMLHLARRKSQKAPHILANTEAILPEDRKLFHIMESNSNSLESRTVYEII